MDRPTLTPAQVNILTALAKGRKLGLADRPEDRARQALRRAGMIEYGGTPNRWHITDAGCVALASVMAA